MPTPHCARPLGDEIRLMTRLPVDMGAMDMGAMDMGALHPGVRPSVAPDRLTLREREFRRQ